MSALWGFPLIYKDYFVESLRQVKAMHPKKKFNPVGKARTYPIAVERSYYKTLYKIFRDFQKQIETFIREQGASLLNGDSVHQDAVPGKAFISSIQILEGYVRSVFPDDPGVPTALTIGINESAQKVKNLRDKQFASETEEILGYEFGTPEAWWEDVRDVWEAQNFKLIKSLADSNISLVNNTVEQAISKGASLPQLMADLKKLDLNVSKSRLRLIARDQIGKLQGQINQHQSEEIGLDLYIWRTAGDERVRGNPAGLYPKAVPTHYEMEGKMCRWDDSSVYSDDEGKTWKDRTSKMPKVHPGMAIQCRCTATSYYGDLFEEAGIE